MQTLTTIPLDDILIPDNRQRRHFDDEKIQSLAESIQSKGLLHPPVVKSDGRTLVAGERRVRALRSILDRGGQIRCNGVLCGDGRIPVVSLGDLDPILVREAELEENVLREDLTWQEQSLAVAELHNLRAEQKKSVGRPQTLTETASEIIGRQATGKQVMAVRDATILAEHMDDEEVSSAPDKKTAMKIITRKAELRRRAELAEKVGSLVSKHQIEHADTFEFIESMPDASVDIIITDPPYGVDAGGFGSMADARHDYDDNLDYSMECYVKLFASASRITRPDAFMFAFLDIRFFQTFYEEFAASVLSDWSVWPTPLIWYKGPSFGMLPSPDRGPRRSYEAILYAYRGKRKWNSTGSSDVIDIQALTKPDFGAQKPDELYEYLLSRVYQPGDVVFDPFAGTGPVVRACDKLSCKAIAVEKSQDRYNYILSRISE